MLSLRNLEPLCSPEEYYAHAEGRMRLQFWNLKPSSWVPFQFEYLPVELGVHILIMAASSSQSTYRALLLVSRKIRDLIRLKCLPMIPITLSKREQLPSFYELVSKQPEVASLVRHLWIVADLTSKEERAIGAASVNACTNLVSLACRPRVLNVSICLPSAFTHTNLVDLTIVESSVPWGMLLETRHGLRYLNQLTHLRIVGRLSHGIPTLNNLTHFCFSSPTSILDVEPNLKELMLSPALQRVVVTVDYMTWRDKLPDFLMDAAHDLDPRIDILHCPKKWKEIEVWERSVRGGPNVWNQAAEKRAAWLRPRESQMKIES